MNKLPYKLTINDLQKFLEVKSGILLLYKSMCRNFVFKIGIAFIKFMI